VNRRTPLPMFRRQSFQRDISALSVDILLKSPSKAKLIFVLTLRAESQHNKQNNSKSPLSNFNLNGYTLGFHPQSQKFKPPCEA